MDIPTASDIQQIPAEMSTQQRGQWSSNPRVQRTSLVDNKHPKRKSISFHEKPAYSASWSPATEFSERVAESRSLQLRKRIDPRGYLLDVLGVKAPRKKTLGVSEKRASIVRAGTVRDLRAPPAPDSLIRVDDISDANSFGGKFSLSRSSTMRYTKALPSLRPTSELGRPFPVEERQCATVEESPRSVSSPDYDSPHDSPASALPPSRRRSDPTSKEKSSEPGRNSDDGASSATPPWLRFSETGRIPRRVSDPGRRETPNATPRSAIGKHPLDDRLQIDATPRSPIGKHPLDTPPKNRLQICWLGLARSFSSEFFPERVRAPLEQTARLPTPLSPERAHALLVQSARLPTPLARTVSLA